MQPQHTQFLIQYLDKHADVTFTQLLEDMRNNFPGIETSISSVQTHIKKHCALSVTRSERYPANRRDTEEIRHQRKNIVSAWLQTSSFSYPTNCVFIDETTFTFQVRRSFVRTQRGQSARIRLPAERGRNLTVFSAIAGAGLIDLSVKVPPGETKWVDFMAFLHNVMDVLDRQGYQGWYLVLDPSLVPLGLSIEQEIVARGYQCVRLPIQSPFLNPVEEFFSKLQLSVPRRPLDEGETLVQRVVEGANQITQNDIRGWIRRAMVYFNRCLNEERDL